jgi:hypothetical protein
MVCYILTYIFFLCVLFLDYDLDHVEYVHTRIASIDISSKNRSRSRSRSTSKVVDSVTEPLLG